MCPGALAGTDERAVRGGPSEAKKAALMPAPTIYPLLSIDAGLIRKAVVHLLGAAIAADGEVAAGAWALTLVGMVAGDVDIRVEIIESQAAQP